MSSLMGSLNHKYYYKMLFLTIWLLVLILERSTGSKHRSVNLALETVLQFDKVGDINVINKMQDFLSNIQVLLNKTSQASDNINTRRMKRYKFTDFVEDLITTVTSFEDNDLKDFFRMVDKEFRTRRLDNDLIDDNVRRFLSRKLTEIKNQTAFNIRKDLDRVLKELRADDKKKGSFFLDFINSLYKRDTEKKFSKLIKRLNIFFRSARKSKVVLKYIIEKVVNDVIFEHYNNLEENEKDYIKKFIKAYFIDDTSIVKNLNIKQRAKETDIIPESINTNEITDESKVLKKQVRAFQLTPQTFKDIPKETMKKMLTHITLYPKTIQVKKLPTGIPKLEVIKNKPTNEENTKDKTNEEETKETNKIKKNQSVEINVNLLLEHRRDPLDRDESNMIEPFKLKYTSKKIFPRALLKSIQNTKYRKSSVPDFSIETFGNLYRGKTPRRYNYKKISGLLTYDSKTTKDDRYFKLTHVNNIVEENKVLDKKYLDTKHRRFDKPTNLNEKKVSELDVKDIVASSKLRSFTTGAFVPLIRSTDKVPTRVVTSEKSTAKTTQNVELNEIFENKKDSDFKEVTNKPLIGRSRTNIDFVQKNNTTPFENESSNHINNKTTETEVSVTFNIKNYVKNSEVLNFEDKEKKKQIEEKIRADFGNLLDTPATNATTESFTDIFKELEDAFKI